MTRSPEKTGDRLPLVFGPRAPQRSPRPVSQAASHGMRVPAGLQQEWQRESEWLTRLPELVRECVEQWGLELEEPFDTPNSLVVPAGDYVLKLNVPSHYEADHEADALDCWAGRGAVRLLARDDRMRALLIERCRPGTRLADSAVDDHSVVAGLLPKLWVKSGDRRHSD